MEAACACCPPFDSPPRQRRGTLHDHQLLAGRHDQKCDSWVAATWYQSALRHASGLVVTGGSQRLCSLRASFLSIWGLIKVSNACES